MLFLKVSSWFRSSFLCEDTVETRILELQQKKLELADGVLTGAKQANKLTFDDLKSLFGLQWCKWVKCSSRKYGSMYLWLILTYLWWQNWCRVRSRTLNRQSYCIHALCICVIYWCWRHPRGWLVHGSINCTYRPSFRSSGIYIHIFGILTTVQGCSDE